MEQIQPHQQQNGGTPGSYQVPDGLELATGPRHGHDDPIVYHQSADPSKGPGYGYGYPPPANPPAYKQKKWIIVGAIITLLVIALAVVGGVLGSKVVANSASNGSAKSSSNGSGLPQAGDLKTTSVKRGSKLAAAGYWMGNDYGIQVFYEKKDGGNMAYSRFEQIFAAWTPSIELKKEAQDDTGFAACVFYLLRDTAAPPDRQTQFYHIAPDSAIDGINWRLSQDSQGVEDSIHNEKIAAGKGSQLACYWPTHVYQDENGGLGGIIYDLGWQRFNISAVAGKNSQLAMLPLKAKHYSNVPQNNLTQTDFRIVYRGEDGFLNAVDFVNGDEQASVKLPASLDKGVGMAAFSVARETGDDVDTWVVFQDSSGNIKYTEQVGDDSWSEIKTMFSGADKGTQIACVTPGTSSSPGTVVLKSTNEMSVCFFQKDGFLKQMKFNGKDWQDLGSVPIP